MRGTAVLVAMLVVIACLAPHQAVAAEKSALDVLGAGLAWVQPFGGEESGFAAFDITLQLLPLDEPVGEGLTLETALQRIGSNLALDILVREDEVSLGLSLPLLEVKTDLPMRVGLAWVSGMGELAWFVQGQFRY